MNLWSDKYGQYEPLKLLLIPVFGEIIVAGISEYEYGTTLCDKNTWDRIRNWDDHNNQKLLDHISDLTNHLNKIF